MRRAEIARSKECREQLESRVTCVQGGVRECDGDRELAFYRPMVVAGESHKKDTADMRKKSKVSPCPVRLLGASQ